MEEFQRRTITTLSEAKNMRCVDVTILVWLHDENTLNGFLHLNTIEESIIFTMEVEAKSIRFLDLPEQKNMDITFKPNVYMKPKHTGQYLHFNFNPPNNVRVEVAICVCDRDKNISSEERDK